MKVWFKSIPFYYFILWFFVGLWGIVVGLSSLSQLTILNIRYFSLILLFPFAYVFFLKLQSHSFFVTKRIEKDFLPQVVFSIVALTLLLAQGLFSAPNTTDAMTYHLPRVMFWLSETTVFPDEIYTNNDFLAPFGSYLYLINFALFGSDRYLFLVQFLSGLSSLYLTYKISFKLFKNENIAWLSASWAALLPTVALQMVSTQIELVTSHFVLLSTVFLLDFVSEKDLRSSLSFPIAVGLAFLTKSTVIFFLPIWILYLFITNSWKNINSKTIRAGLIGGIIALSILGLFFLQNVKLYGKPFGELRFGSTAYSFSNDVFSLSVLFSNLIRNSFIHVPVPIGTEYVQNVIEQFHDFIDLPLNDERTTWIKTQFHVQRIIFPQEDIVSNPVHFLLIIVMSFWLITSKNKSKELIWIVLSFWLFWFSFALLLKWQPWHSRLHLPIFFYVCLGLPQLFIKRQRFQNALLLLSGILSILIIVTNTSHSYFPYSKYKYALQAIIPSQQNWPESFLLSSRTDQYFMAQYEWSTLAKMHISTIERSSIRSICFELMDGFEYPFWAILKNRLSPEVKTSHNCDSVEADVEIVTSNTPSSYINKGYLCAATEKQDKFLCIKD